MEPNIKADIPAIELTKCRHCGFRVKLNEAPDSQPASTEPSGVVELSAGDERGIAYVMAAVECYAKTGSAEEKARIQRMLEDDARKLRAALAAPVQAQPVASDKEKLDLLINRLSLANRRDGWTVAAQDAYHSEATKRAKEAVERAEKNLRDYITEVVAAPQPVAIPEGYWLAPIELTEQMIQAVLAGASYDATMAAIARRGVIANWTKLRAASPAIPATVEGEEQPPLSMSVFGTREALEAERARRAAQPADGGKDGGK